MEAKYYDVCGGRFMGVDTKEKKVRRGEEKWRFQELKLCYHLEE